MTNIMVLSVLLCFVAGSAIDTGSICLVRTVNEAVAGKPGLALGCLVALLCAALVLTLDTALNWQLQTPPRAWPTAGIVVGAVVFGAGVALNGACGIGTITRLCRGDIGYAATVAGALAVSQLVPRTMLPTPKTDGAVTLGLAWFAAIGLVALPPLLILRQHLARRIIVSFASTWLDRRDARQPAGRLDVASAGERNPGGSAGPLRGTRLCRRGSGWRGCDRQVPAPGPVHPPRSACHAARGGWGRPDGNRGGDDPGRQRRAAGLRRAKWQPSRGCCFGDHHRNPGSDPGAQPDGTKLGGLAETVTSGPVERIQIARAWLLGQ